MGKSTGFMEFGRELPAKRPISERTKDYREFVEKYAEPKLNQQASRCMNCGVPFCHSGCPLGNLIPDFNDAVFRKNYEEAYHILVSTNNFPEFTGRICPAPCESACVLGINKPAVVIEEIERHIIEIAFEKGWVKPFTPILQTGKKVAVIGSGPAGLAAAAQLHAAGHQVTVFERDYRPGGLLRYGIPDFKLEKNVVERRIKLMEESGIMFQCNTEVGKDYLVGDLMREFHAVVLACGATIPRDLDIPHRKGQGVHFAMEFLKQQNQQNAGDQLSGKVTAHGKNVVVIGGGDTGSDCIGTSIRQGAKSVTQLEILPQPPVDRSESMPWPTYPMILRTSSSQEEGCERHWSIVTKSFERDGQGNLTGLRVADISWQQAKDGKPAGYQEIADSERIIEAELVLLAMGFLHTQHDSVVEEMGIELDTRGNVKASETEFATSLPKVFACGDMRRGQSLVVWAISEGRECARKVDEYLMGSSMLETKHSSVFGVMA